MSATEPQRELSASEREWARVRAYVLEHRFELGIAAATSYPEIPTVAGTPLLAPSEWLPEAPIALDAVKLSFDATAALGSDAVEPSEAWLQTRRPDGSLYDSHVETLLELTHHRPQNRTTYRLYDADLSGGAGHMTFGRGRYFDGLNTGDVVAHEFTAAQLGAETEFGLRAAIGDPCDPRRRPMNVAISTLTVRYDREAGAASFLLHRRDPARVAHAGGMFQVLPVGVFQASSDAPWNEQNDFDLWRCIVRESAEEILGQSEDYRSDVAPIDYAAWPFAARIDDARKRGTVRAYCLGMGVDPLTFATDLLTVTVVDADPYDDLFGDAVRANTEGTVVADVPFTSGSIDLYSGEKPMQAAGAALLRLAWRHRDALIPTGV